MRSLKNVNIQKSIKTKKMVFDESIYDKWDSYFQYFVYMSLIISSILGLNSIEKSDQNISFEFAFFCVPMVIAVYSLYCKLMEKRLKEIKFRISKEEAYKRVVNYGIKDNYRISKISSNLIYLNEWTGEVSRVVNERTTIIFFTESSILYTLIKEGRRINSPVMINQHIVKRELKKLLK